MTVRSILLQDARDDRILLRVHCSAGFYVRSLAHDLGQRLGTGAHLAALRRIQSGDVSVADALSLDIAERDPEAARRAVVPLDRMLPALSAVVLTGRGASRAAHGRDLTAADLVAGAIAAEGAVRLIDEAGRLVGIAEPAASPGVLHPSVVLV